MNQWIAYWVVASARHAKLVCIFFAVSCVVLASYAANNLGINTKTTDMLSADLQWRQNLINHEKYFPHLTDTLVAVIDAQTPMLAMQARDQLASELEKHDDQFLEVFVPAGGGFFRQHGLLFLELEQLDELIDQLTQIQPFLGRLDRGERLSGFFGLLEQSLANPEQSDSTELIELIGRTTTTIQALQDERFERMQWGQGGSTRQLIVLKSKLAFKQLLPAKQAIELVQDTVEGLNLIKTQGVQVRLTGTIALQSDELKLLAGSMPLSGLIALILVSIVLFFAMRHPVLIFSSVATLLLGLVFTGAFAAFSVGYLNLVSVAFALLFIGLGIDFAIHFCLRYKELLNEKFAHLDALHTTATDVGSSLMLCSITTSAGFLAFVPTSFKGVSELGIISGMGMIISLFTTLTLLPALLSLKPIKTPDLYDRAHKFSRVGGIISDKLINDPKNSRRLIVAFSIILIASVPISFAVSFDNNPINLRSPKSDSVSAYRDLLNDPQTSPLSLSIMSKDQAQLDALKAKLQALETVDKVVGISDFVPDQQQDKLDLLGDLEFILGGTSASADDQNDIELPAQQLVAMSDLLEQLSTSIDTQNYTVEESNQLISLRATLTEFQANLLQQTALQKESQLDALSDRLLGDLLVQMQRIREGLNSEGIDQSQIPSDLKRRWVSDEGHYKLQIFPAEQLTDKARATKFVRSVTALAPDAVGSAVVNLEGGEAIVQSFQQAFVSAFILIFLLLLILLRRLGDALLVLTPLVLTAPLVVAITVLLDIPFNYANIITLPLLLGISVDNGVHMIHRARHALCEQDHLLASSTGRAVVFSAATTVVSFGNLAFSPHIGTAGMGLLLTIGMTCSLFCTLILLPMLINRFIRTVSV